MKTSFIILLAFLTPSIVSASIVGGMIPVSGGINNDGKYGIVCGPPVYDYFKGCQGFGVLISNPLNGSNLFWTISGVSENVTVSVFGTSPSLCQFKINNGLWNNFTHCGLGVNNTWQGIVTMPEGYPVTLSVNITSSCGSVINQTQFNVYYPHGQPWFADIDDEMNIVYLYWACLLAVFAGYTLYPRRRRKNVFRKHN